MADSTVQTPTVDYDALAEQHGGSAATQAAPSVDYDALAQQHGAVSSAPSDAAPTNTDLGQSVRGVYEGAVQPLIHAALHPIDTVTQLVPNMVQSEGRM